MRIIPRKFLREDHGLTTVEYAVAGALVTTGVVAAFILLSGSVENAILVIVSNLTP